MKFILGVILVMAVPFFLGISRNNIASIVGRGMLLLITLGFGAGMVYFLLLPFFTDLERGSGVVTHGTASILASIGLFIVGLIPFGFLMFAQGIVSSRTLIAEADQMEKFRLAAEQANKDNPQANLKDTATYDF